MIFLVILAAFPLLDIAWWWWGDRRLRSLGLGAPARVALAVFTLAQLALFAWMIVSRIGVGSLDSPLLIAWATLWHLLALPIGVGIMTAWTMGKAGSKAVRSRSVPVSPPPPPAPGWTRRQLLATAAVALPPLAATAATVRGMSQLDDLRLRRVDVPLPGLPPALEGLTIAHITDVHVGRFTRGAILGEIVDRTNALGADIVLCTGDLIDHALADLPAALELTRSLRAPLGVWLCEGNHDLFQGRDGFERGVRGAGVNLLVNEAATLRVRGEPLQLLGLRWGGSAGGRGADLDENMREVLALRDPDAFGILLAHHPHAFDAAAAAGIPLTLSGHTHGGQLNLTDRVGFGPALYRYWSGLYRSGASAAFVSNGAGNWLPLRTAAPAEIVHLTLRRA